MSRRILIMKDLNYGTQASSANDALSPELLADGACGIYGVVGSQSTNNAYKTALIVDHASTDIAGNYADELFRANKSANPDFQVVQGTTNGGLMGPNIPIDGVTGVVATEYEAPVKQISTIGYNELDGAGGAGLLNLPTITAKQESLVKPTHMNYQAGGEPHNRQNFGPGSSLIDAETDYNLVVKMLAGLASKTDINLDGFIVSETAGSVFGTSATVTAVNGATSLTTSAAHAVGVGDYVRLTGSNGVGDTYLAVTGTASTTLVLDQPYRGISETITNANTKDLSTAAGELGIALVAQNFNDVYEFSVSDALEDATITINTPSTTGSGSYEHVARLESDRQVTKGYWDQITTYYPTPSSHSVVAETYDLYFLNYRTSSLVNENAFATENELIVAFPDAGSNGGQAEFEDIMGQLINGADGLGGIDAA